MDLTGLINLLKGKLFFPFSITALIGYPNGKFERMNRIVAHLFGEPLKGPPGSLEEKINKAGKIVESIFLRRPTPQTHYKAESEIYRRSWKWEEGKVSIEKEYIEVQTKRLKRYPRNDIKSIEKLDETHPLNYYYDINLPTSEAALIRFRDGSLLGLIPLSYPNDHKFAPAHRERLDARMLKLLKDWKPECPRCGASPSRRQLLSEEILKCRYCDTAYINMYQLVRGYGKEG